MDTNNAMPPKNPSQQQTGSGPAMSNGAKNMDLYNAIVGEVQEEEILAPQKKKRPTVVMSTVVWFMKLTFYFDSIKRNHETLFHFFGGIWTGIMAILYTSGVIALFLSIYARARLPLYLENFFDKYNLKYEKLKMMDYSLSKINVVNLHDGGNKYIVPQLVIHSTFADFLQGRIRTIIVDGLQINLSNKNSKENNLENLFKVLGLIANPAESGLDLKVNSITVNNAILSIEENDTKIPINFSMSGLYTNKAQIVVPFSVDENFLKLNASLSVSGNESDRSLSFSIKSGTFTPRNHHPEDLKGSATIQLNKNKISKVQANLDLSYGYGLKTLNMNLSNSDKGYNGDVSFVYKNTAEKDADLKPLMDLFFRLTNLKFTENQQVETSSPLTIKINRLAYGSVILEGFESILSGSLKCALSESECKYELKQKASVRYQNLALRFKEQNVFINESGNFTILPSSNTFGISLKNSEIDLNWILSNLDLEGFYNSQTSTLKIKTDTCQLQGKFFDSTQKSSLNLKTEKLSYQTPNLQMENVLLDAKDLLEEKAPIHFTADEVLTSSPLLTIPVSIDLNYLDQKINADIKIKNSDIVLKTKGYLKPFQKTFTGQFVIQPVELQDVPFNLSELSPLFSQRINNLSGQVMAMGQLNFTGSNNISGPMYIGLKNVNFNLDETEVKQVNGVFALQSLLPLVSAPKQVQMLSIGKINKLIPFTNIQVGFQLENQALRLLNVEAQLGKENLSTTNTLIPYRTPNALFYLKSGKDFKMDTLAPYLNLAGIKPLGGTGSLSVPVDISDGTAKVVSAILKVNNLTLQQVPGKKDDIDLFKQGNNGYMIRNGQLVLDAGGNLQVDLDGWLIMPSRKTKKEAFTQNDIQLSDPLFKAGSVNPVPNEISERQKSLLQSLKEFGN